MLSMRLKQLTGAGILEKKVSGLCLLTGSPVGPLNPCRFMMRTVSLSNTTRSAPGPQNKETKIKKPRTRRGFIRIFGRDNVRGKPSIAAWSSVLRACRPGSSHWSRVFTLGQTRDPLAFRVFRSMRLGANPHASFGFRIGWCRGGCVRRARRPQPGGSVSRYLWTPGYVPTASGRSPSNAVDRVSGLRWLHLSVSLPAVLFTTHPVTLKPPLPWRPRPGTGHSV